MSASDADTTSALASIDDILDSPYVGAELANDINEHLDVIRNAIASSYVRRLLGDTPSDPTPDCRLLTQERYGVLSQAVRGLMREIMSGPHNGAYPAEGTDAEAVGLAAGCLVTDGAHVWVASGFAHLVDEAARADQVEELRTRAETAEGERDDLRRLAVGDDGTRIAIDGVMTVPTGVVAEAERRGWGYLYLGETSEPVVECAAMLSGTVDVRCGHRVYGGAKYCGQHQRRDGGETSE